MSTLTPNFSFILPGVADPTDEDLWGGYLNDNLTSQDSLLTDIPNSRLNDMAAQTVKVNATSSSAVPTDLAMGTSTILGRGPTGNIFPIAVSTGLSITDTALTATTVATGFNTVTMQVFTSSGTYTPSSGMVYCQIECQGGGGAGAGNASSSSCAGGGGGAYTRSIISASSIGSSQTVTVGAGGGFNPSGTGGAGGTTSVGSLITAAGGGGGTSGGLGGGGGTTGTGQFKINGASGVEPSGSGSGAPAGDGGDSFMGIGGKARVASTGPGIVAPSGYGAGGQGEFNGTDDGAAGTAGVVIITEYRVV